MKIGFIGTGNMGGSILRGVVENGFAPDEITITNRTMEKTEQFRNLGVKIVETSSEVISRSDIIILGMKPDGYQPWLDENDITGKKIISIAAGITSQFMEKYTNDYAIVMPNTPSKLGFGSTLIVNGNGVNEDVLAIFKSIGSVYQIDENELDIYTLVTGCSSAYYFSFVENMSNIFANQYNLDKTTVTKMLIEVMSGSSAMLRETPDPQYLSDQVCTPGGITIEVVKQLNHDLPSTLKTGFESAIERTNQMKNNK